MKCVKGQPHDHKHLMPTQIIPGSGKITREWALFPYVGKTQYRELLYCFFSLCITQNLYSKFINNGRILNSSKLSRQGIMDGN